MAGMKSQAVSGANASAIVGRAVEDLNLTERWQHANAYAAFRIYTPPEKVSRGGVEFPDVRHRMIEAAGRSIPECVAQLRSRNLDPAQFEFTILKPPY